VNDDAATAQHCGWSIVDAGAHLTVVNEAVGFSGVAAPNPDTELVNSAAAIDLTINGGKNERIIASTVDRADAFLRVVS
jgi:hypothetical protein